MSSLAILKRCLTKKGFLHTQASTLSDRDLYFLRCAWLYGRHLETTCGKTWFHKYAIALCREGNPTVTFVEEPMLNLLRFFNASPDEYTRLSIKRILDEKHCAHGVHMAADDTNPARYSFDVVVWVRCSLQHLETFFSVSKEKVPGHVAMLQYKCGFSSGMYLYNLTCSYPMIMGMAIDTRKKLATDSCNRCKKTRSATTKLSTCQQCRTIRYCGRDCQVADWQAGHSSECKRLREWADDGVKLYGPFITVDTSLEKTAATAMDNMLDHLKTTDPVRYSKLTLLM